jgi:NADH dehydrogenase/NADH:ubiquinone oxidoreductase subunit G
MILTINGRPLAATPGETLLTVARRAGIDVPTLCHHEGLEPWGGCRLCVVELRRRPDEAPRVVPSCLQLAEDGLRVETHSENVLRIRATLLDLLLTRAPNSELIRKLALEHGVADGTFVPREPINDCILCTLCTRACAAIGAHAISTAGRGAEGEVSLPFLDDASACVGCGSCAAICPTGCIAMTDQGNRRTIWGRTFERVPCEVTGRPTLTREFAALLAKRTGLPEDSFFVTDEGRRRQTADTIAALVSAGEGRAA